MKKTINAGISSRNFVMDEDAYERLASYLDSFRDHINIGDKKEVMEELESRIAELFELELTGSHAVVSIELVNKVIAQLGMPDGSEPAQDSPKMSGDERKKAKKKLYRDPDDKVIGGVCSGLAAYFDTDVVIIRIVFVALLICASAGGWAYIIFWIAVPKAHTAAQKCEMRGLPLTAENLASFTTTV